MQDGTENNGVVPAIMEESRIIKKRATKVQQRIEGNDFMLWRFRILTIPLGLSVMLAACTGQPHPAPTSTASQSTQEPTSTTQTIVYQIHDVSANDYLSAAPTVLEKWKMEEHQEQLLPQIIDREIRQNSYWETGAYLQLYQAYSAINFSILLYNRDEWNHAIIQAWLDQEQPELRNKSRFTFESYVINVIPRDFNADGQNEWLLHVAEDTNTFQQYMVVQSTPTGGYRIVPAPIPWSGLGFHYSMNPSGEIEIFRFQDINEDELPEWVFGFGGMGANHLTYGGLHVLAWRDNALVNLVPKVELGEGLTYLAPAGGGASFYHPDLTWGIKNLDGDSAQEIRKQQKYKDNWGCVSHETTIFKWNADQDQYAQTAQDYELEIPSIGCSVRLGQISMWDKDYRSAIRHFEEALALYHTDGASVYRLEGIQYVRLRLALAYALLGDNTHAERIMADIRKEQPASDLIRGIIGAASSRPVSPGLCVALYNTFAKSDPWKTGTYWGAVENLVVPLSSVGAPSPDARRAGCDAPGLLNQALATHVFTTFALPVEQLDGLGILSSYQLSFDLNSDGHQEWLVWPDVEGVQPIFFAPSGNSFVVTRPDILRPGIELDYSDARVLSDIKPLTQSEEGQVLATIFEYKVPDGMGYWNEATRQVYTSLSSYTCADRTSTEGSLRLWRLGGTALERFFEMRVCDETTLADIFPDNQIAKQFSGWAPQYSESTHWVGSVYRWDDEASTYLSASVSPIPIPSEETSSTQPLIYSAVLNIYNDNKPDASIADFNKAIAELPENIDVEWILAARYWRAYLLHQAGHDREALEDYLWIIQAAPQSAWSSLASLHLKPTGPG